MNIFVKVLSHPDEFHNFLNFDVLSGESGSNLGADEFISFFGEIHDFHSLSYLVD